MINNIENDPQGGHTAGRDSVRYNFESRTAKTKRKAPKIIFVIIGLIVAITGAIIIFRSFASTLPSVGAVNNWFNTDGGTRLSVNMTPLFGEEGYHFYSLAPLFKGLNYGLYSGIQTNGNLGDGKDVGNIFVFSVWNAKSAKPENGAVATPFGGEGVGYSLRMRYDWKVGNTYKIEVYRVGQNQSTKEWVWAASITNLTDGKSVKIGEINGTPQSEKLGGGSAFHERYIGFSPVCTATSSNLEKAGVRFSSLSSDAASSFAGNSGKNNVFTSADCANFIQVKNSSTEAFTGFGVAGNDFSKAISPVTSSASSIPVYRHYSPSRGAHFFTTNKAESDKIKSQGWNYEGIAWQVSSSPNSKPVYRHYSPSRGRHFYTTNKAESDKIKSQGWNYEGIAWYASPTQTTIPIFRHYSPSRGAHFYTRDKNESDKIKSQGWNFEGIEYYAF